MAPESVVHTAARAATSPEMALSMISTDPGLNPNLRSCVVQVEFDVAHYLTLLPGAESKHSTPSSKNPPSATYINHASQHTHSPKRIHVHIQRQAHTHTHTRTHHPNHSSIVPSTYNTTLWPGMSTGLPIESKRPWSKGGGDVDRAR